MSNYPKNYIGEDLMPDHIGETHVPCVLLLDASKSMEGNPIRELNKGLQKFDEALREDHLALGRAEVNVIVFNSEVHEVTHFMPASKFESPVLTAGGCTSMNEAIIKGLQVLEQRKDVYYSYGIDYYRPWMFLLTDGYATDPELEDEAIKTLRDYQKGKKVTFFPMGIGDKADFGKLSEYTADGTGLVFKAEKDNFASCFVWLSKSIRAIAHSDHNQDVPLPPVPREIQAINVNAG